MESTRYSSGVVGAPLLFLAGFVIVLLIAAAFAFMWMRNGTSQKTTEGPRQLPTLEARSKALQQLSESAGAPASSSASALPQAQKEATLENVSKSGAKSAGASQSDSEKVKALEQLH